MWGDYGEFLPVLCWSVGLVAKSRAQPVYPRETQRGRKWSSWWKQRPRWRVSRGTVAGTHVSLANDKVTPVHWTDLGSFFFSPGVYLLFFSPWHFPSSPAFSFPCCRCLCALQFQSGIALLFIISIEPVAHISSLYPQPRLYCHHSSNVKKPVSIHIMEGFASDSHTSQRMGIILCLIFVCDALYYLVTFCFS